MRTAFPPALLLDKNSSMSERPFALSQVAVSLVGRTVLGGVHATVEAGQFIVVVGPNGAGKTTLLRAMAGLIPPQSGTVQCFGMDPAVADRRTIASLVAYLPQQYELAFPFLVEEVVLFGRYASQRGLGLPEAADLEAARAAMVACDVADLAERRFDELSGGEARRAVLAQALCQGARCLLLDEPTAGLDPSHARAVFELVKTQCEAGRAAVVATHDLDLALRYGETMWLVANGTIESSGKPSEVLVSAATRRAFHVGIHVGTLPSGQPFAVPQ